MPGAYGDMEYNLKKSSNGIYYVHWTDGRRSKRVSTGAREMVTAAAFLTEWLTLDRAQAKHTRLTVADLWAAYEREHVAVNVMAPKTARGAWANLSTHFGALRPPDVDANAVASYLGKRRGGVIGRPSKPATVRRELVVLRAVLNWSASPRRGLVDPTALRHFDLPADSEPRDRWLREEELKALFDTAERLRVDGRISRAERILWLGIYTAGRKGALADLEWSRVDLETGVIDLNKPGRKKTKKRRAVVQAPPNVIAFLKICYAQRDNGFVLGHAHNIARDLATLARAAGVDGVTPHVLRHSVATLAARNGVSLWKVAGLLADSLKTVEKTYAKHAPETALDVTTNIFRKTV